MQLYLLPMSIIIHLHLKNSCIETEVKKEFKKLCGNYLESEEQNSIIEYKIKLLLEIIEITNFRELRNSDKRFTGNTRTPVDISRNENGKIQFEFTE